MTRDPLLEAITSYYLCSEDFNGYRVASSGVPCGDLKPLLCELISEGLISLHCGIPHPNPHIKAFDAQPPDTQLATLAKLEDLTHLTAYPARKHLETIVDRDEFSGRPYTVRLALGEAQLTPVFFELSVLEIYRNDPRYFYQTDDQSGYISVSGAYYDTTGMKGTDQVMLKFGYGLDDDLRRAVCVFAIDLSRLTPEHQQIWSARELDGTHKMHPGYFDSAIRGEFPEKVSIFDAFLEELEQLQKMSAAAGLPPLVRRSFQDAKPPNFTFLIRPTLKELEDFHATLDKMMSENLNKEFLAEFVKELETATERRDGKFVVTSKGTIVLLDEWMEKIRFPDRAPVDEMLATFREVRKLRQRPAHSTDDNDFDLKYYDDQRELMIRAYSAVRTLRQVLANHPALTNYDEVPEWLYDGAIYPF